MTIDAASKQVNSAISERGIELGIKGVSVTGIGPQNPLPVLRRMLEGEFNRLPKMWAVLKMLGGRCASDQNALGALTVLSARGGDRRRWKIDWRAERDIVAGGAKKFGQLGLLQGTLRRAWQTGLTFGAKLVFGHGCNGLLTDSWGVLVLLQRAGITGARCRIVPGYSWFLRSN